MHSIAERATHRRFRAWAAHNTIDVIAERIEGMVRTGRRMTVVERYLGNDNEPTIKTGLVLDTDSRKGGVDIWTQINPVGKGIHINLAPGFNGFGVAAYTKDGDEDTIREKWHSGRRREDLTFVEVDGDATGHGREDRIEIVHYNQYGVGHQVIVAFDTVDEKTISEEQAALLDALAAEARRTGEPWTPENLDTLAQHLRYTWDTLPTALTERATGTPQ